MARSAKRPEPVGRRSSPAVLAASALGGAVARNPVLVGGSTAFLVALSFVSANALWYQPFAHPDAFFVTRMVERSAVETPLPETTIRIERPESAPRQVAIGDPTTKAVQIVLKELNLYDGTVDGVPGPGTRRAVEAYQKTVGLPVTGAIDDKLLEQLDTNPTAGITPQPRPTQVAVKEPAPERFQRDDKAPAAASAERIKAIQLGLREFGNKDVDADGLLGSRTRTAIMEFQALFGLKKTGEADEAVYAKMKKERLIQ